MIMMIGVHTICLIFLSSRKFPNINLAMLLCLYFYSFCATIFESLSKWSTISLFSSLNLHNGVCIFLTMLHFTTFVFLACSCAEKISAFVFDSFWHFMYKLSIHPFPSPSVEGFISSPTFKRIFLLSFFTVERVTSHHCYKNLFSHILNIVCQIIHLWTYTHCRAYHFSAFFCLAK